MTANQKLLLLALEELQNRNRRIRILRRKCHSHRLQSVLALQQLELSVMESEGRQLAFQRGLEPPESIGIFLFPWNLQDMAPGSRDARIARNWVRCNSESLVRCSRALRRYTRTDPVSILCQKTIDFSTAAIRQMDAFL